MGAFFPKRTDSADTYFVTFVWRLDTDLAIRNGEEHAFYAQFNKIGQIWHTIVAYREGHAVDCGVIKPLEEEVMEVMRMFVIPEFRGQGIAMIASR